MLSSENMLKENQTSCENVFDEASPSRSDLIIDEHTYAKCGSDANLIKSISCVLNTNNKSDQTLAKRICEAPFYKEEDSVLLTSVPGTESYSKASCINVNSTQIGELPVSPLKSKSATNYID